MGELGETDVKIGPDYLATGKLRICRIPDCLITFDPAWRVKLENEPPEMEHLCPRCGADLDRNSFIRRSGDEVLVPVSQER